MKIIAANNASTILSAAISSTATTLTVSSGTGASFPSPLSGASYFKLTLIDAATESLNEIVHVTSVSGDVFTIVRGQEGTTARTWSVSDIAANMITAGTIAAMAQYDSAEFIAATTGRLINIQYFTTAGEISYKPTSGTKRGEVFVTGAGGSGGGCQATSRSQTFSGAGGGAGGTAIKLVNIDETLTYSGYVGFGGERVNGAAAGNVGGASTLLDVTAPGGGGGNKVGTTSTPGGVAGVPTSGDLNISGGFGEDGQANDFLLPGNGGASFWGGGGRAGNGAGVDGTAYGSGGGGAYDSALSGIQMMSGRGKNGMIMVKEYA